LFKRQVAPARRSAQAPFSYGTPPVIYADGSITEVHTGRNGPFVLSPADAKRFGLPAVSVDAGKLAFSVSAPPRAITSLVLHGHVLVDVCAALG